MDLRYEHRTRPKPVLVQKLVPKPTIERLDERMICWLSKPAEVEFHAARVRLQIQVPCRLRAGFPVDLPGKDCLAYSLVRRMQLARRTPDILHDLLGRRLRRFGAASLVA